MIRNQRKSVRAATPKNRSQKSSLEHTKLKRRYSNLREKYKLLKEKYARLKRRYKKLKTTDLQQPVPSEPVVQPETEPENPEAVPLNNFWNSLTLNPSMYNPIFSIKEETPEVWTDPSVWNIIYASVPPEYTIPDPTFTNELTQYVAWDLVKPTISSEQPLELDHFLQSLQPNQNQ